MFGSSPRGAHAYAKVGLETGVAAASPHQLIAMLFDGAITAVKAAAGHMRAREIEKKGKAISKAITIIENGMRASLDKKNGGEIAANLDALYEYMSGRLLEANLHNNTGMLEEVENLLSGLKISWDAIGSPAKASVAAPMPRPPAYGNLAPRASALASA